MGLGGDASVERVCESTFSTANVALVRSVPEDFVDLFELMRCRKGAAAPPTSSWPRKKAAAIAEAGIGEACSEELMWLRYHDGSLRIIPEGKGGVFDRLKGDLDLAHHSFRGLSPGYLFSDLSRWVLLSGDEDTINVGWVFSGYEGSEWG